MGADAEKLFGIGGAVSIAVALNAAGGVDILDSAAVPAGTLWVVTSATAYNNNRSTTLIQFGTLRGGNFYFATALNNTPQYVGVSIPLELVLFPGDKLRSVHIGAVAADVLFMYGTGYSMTAP